MMDTSKIQVAIAPQGSDLDVAIDLRHQLASKNYQRLLRQLGNF